jgi:hypothetical protein
MFTHVYHRGKDGRYYWLTSVPGDCQEWYQLQHYRAYVSSLPGRCVF